MIHPEQERVRKLLTEAVTLLCRNSLQFEEEVMVEGLLGITLDKRDVLLVSIRETVQQTLREVTSSSRYEKETVPPPSPGKRRRRKRSQDSDSDGPPSTPAKKPTPDPISDDQDSRPDPEQRLKVNVKKETPEDYYDDSDHDQNNTSQTLSKVDGRNFHPAHDSTSQSLPPEGHTRLKQEPYSEDSAGGMRIKQESEEGDECFVIDSDGEDMSDSSRSNSMSLSMLENQLQMASQNWAAVDGPGGFDLSNLSQQGANWSGQFEGSGPQMQQGGNPGNMSFMGSPQPGTSQDGPRNWDDECPLCHKRCTNVKRHFREVHLQERKFRCDICEVNFSQRISRDRHMLRKHTQDRAYACRNCGKRFAVKIDLMRHVKLCMTQSMSTGT